MVIADKSDEARGASTNPAISNRKQGVRAVRRRRKPKATVERQKSLASFPRLTSLEALSRLLLSKGELAAVLNVSERTIDNWLVQKRIPRLCLSSRLTRFNLPKVEAALERFEVREVGARR